MLHTQVILLNMGGPQSNRDVRAFLKAMFSDPDMIPLPAKSVLAPLIAGLRAPIARRRYAQIGGGSPILQITETQARQLSRELAQDGADHYRVTIGMRYTSPSIEEAFRGAAQDAAKRIVAVSMYPQFCRATIGSSLGELRRVHASVGNGPPLTIVDRYFDDPGYLQAVECSIERAITDLGGDPFVLFSAHGVPEKLVHSGDPYVGETRISAKCIAHSMGLSEDQWQLAFQSRLGPVRWVSPFTEDVIQSLSRKGIKRLVIVPISFTADNLETLYDMDHVFCGLARKVGIDHVQRASALNASPRFIQALADLVRSVDH